MAHLIRPDEYEAIDNFYTVTVYEKRRRSHSHVGTLLGADTHRRGCDLYFERHDGTAATCDDFVAAMEAASGRDLSQFKRWYSQTGTPRLVVLITDAQHDRLRLAGVAATAAHAWSAAGESTDGHSARDGAVA